MIHYKRGEWEMAGAQVNRTASQPCISAVAWQPRQLLSLDEWLHQGKRFGSISRGAGWWVGDWINYGNSKFGEKYSRAAHTTGYDVQSLMNMAYVASRFDVSRRRSDLSWSHHAEVASLTADQQEHWLWLASENGLSVRRLRDELRKLRSRVPAGKNAEESICCPNPVDHPDGDRADDTDESRPRAVCPRCGYALDHVLKSA
ncbi:MAG: hypothetical protein ACRDSP_19365 [Pseudonocardiaceae bacterium]